MESWEVWQVPPELKYPTPRRVRLPTYVTLWFGFILGIFILVPLAIDLGWVWDYLEIGKLEHSGTHTTGTITKLYSSSSKSGMRYVAEYTFDDGVPGGSPTPYQAEYDVSEADYAGLKVGEPAPVVYLPGDPQTSILNLDGLAAAERAAADKLGEIPFLDGFLLILYAAISLAFWLPLHRQKRLLQWGVPAEAKILSQKAYSVRSLRYWKIAYSFERGGIEIRGKTRGIPVGEALNNPTVLFDPKHARRSMFYTRRASILAIKV